jgi:acyl-CoA synthetase (AMP-forming)/AMP-acid ligase II
LCTSGTSGAAKVVLLEERHLAYVAEGIARHHRLGPNDRGLSPLPLFHVNAEVVGLLATLAGRATLVVDDRFHRTGFWELVAGRGITWVNAVPAIISVLAGTEMPLPAPTTVRFVRSASAPLPAVTARRFEQLTGLAVVETYGMTEAASMITANPLDGPRRLGSVGLPVGTELRVMGPEGTEPSAGVVGRVEIRGPGVIRAYAAGGPDAFGPDGWLHTGDLGYRDEEGYLYLVGRADDLINRGGENIFPREIEEVLLTDPAVAQAAVIGLPDPVLGARPVAYVVPTGARRGTGGPGPEPEEADAAAELAQRLLALCQSALSHYKVPDAVHVVGRLPTGPTGKVTRRTVMSEIEGLEGTGRPAPGPTAVWAALP